MHIGVAVDLVDHRRGRPPAGVAGDHQVAAGGIQDRGGERVPEHVRPDHAQPGALPRAGQHPPGRDRRPRLPGLLAVQLHQQHPVIAAATRVLGR